VTSGLVRKEYGEATRAKHTIEQRQRDEAAERKRRGVECVNFPSSSPYLSSYEANSRVHVFDCVVFFLFFLGMCPSTLKRIYRVACRHLRRRGELRSRQSLSTRTRLLMRDNLMIMMVVRRSHRDCKPIPHPQRSLHDFFLSYTSYTVPLSPIPFLT